MNGREKLAEGLRANIIAGLSVIPRGSSVAVCLSAGVDSVSIAIMCDLLGLRVHAYSFTMDGWLSRDFSVARANCARRGWVFHPVFLPRGEAELKAGLLYIIRDLGLDMKSDIEALWPFQFIARECAEPFVLTGLGAEEHFGLTRKQIKLHTGRLDTFDAFRRLRYDGQYVALQKMFPNDKCLYPYENEPLRAMFQGTPWSLINKPKHKQIIHDAFPELGTLVEVRHHQSLQCGDSGIKDHLASIVKTDWNVGGWLSPMGIYNAITAKRLPPA